MAILDEAVTQLGERITRYEKQIARKWLGVLTSLLEEEDPAATRAAEAATRAVNDLRLKRLRGE